MSAGTTDSIAAAAQEMVEVEIREAPRPLPVLAPSDFAATSQGVEGTLDLGTAGVSGGAAAGAASGGVNSFPDSTSLSPDALFRAYLEREREVGGRNVSEEVRLYHRSAVEMLRECACVKTEEGAGGREAAAGVGGGYGIPGSRGVSVCWLGRPNSGDWRLSQRPHRPYFLLFFFFAVGLRYLSCLWQLARAAERALSFRS